MSARSSPPLVLVLVLVLVVAGCPRPQLCREGTVFVDLTFDALADDADHLKVQIDVDGAMLRADNVAYAGASSFGLEVQFPGGYPMGKQIAIRVTAARGGSDLETGSTSATLDGSCARLSLALLGADGGPPDVCEGPCLLTALAPTLANTNTLLTLEGTFGSVANVHFPGAIDVAATVLGPHRATVVVPAQATAGDLTVTTGGQTVGPLSFRRASFTVEVARFRAPYEQADGARPTPRLVTPRQQYTTATFGHSIYIFGGNDGGAFPSTTVEQATLNADGTLSAFALVPGVTLDEGLAGASSLEVGDALYLVGGQSRLGVAASIKRASFAADGTLSTFADVDGVALTTARSEHTSVVVGNAVYVLGGRSASQVLATVERAPLLGDGTLGPFTPVAGADLTTARFGHTSVVVGNFLYVLGGQTSGGYLATVERARINADGSLSPFENQPGLALTTPRYAATMAYLANTLYVVGGASDATTLLSSVERASLQSADGELSGFASLPSVQLSTARSGHASFVVGNSLHVLGGQGAAGLLASVEHALLDAGCTVASFTIIPGASLLSPRAAHSKTVVGGWLYLVGGAQDEALSLATVDRAAIAPDGALSPFTRIAAHLVTPRQLHAAVVVGNWLYIIGGTKDGSQVGAGPYLTSVERAPIDVDGTLGDFAVVPNVSLLDARNAPTLVAVGGSLYVLGGSSTSVERATINTDGTLSTFTLVSGVTLKATRVGNANVLLGDSIYTVGGQAFNALVIERSAVGADGKLSTFAIVPGVELSIDREGIQLSVVGNALYALGGLAWNGVLDSLERATVASDGSLSSFATVNGDTMVTHRSYHTSVILGNFVYALGGRSAGGKPITSVEQGSLQ